MEFLFEYQYVIIDQLYDKFSITKPIKLDLSDRLQNQRSRGDQRAKSRVCVFAGYGWRKYITFPISNFQFLEINQALPTRKGREKIHSQSGQRDTYRIVESR